MRLRKSEVYQQMIDVLDARGWCQHHFQRQGTGSPVCVMGAMNVALYNNAYGRTLLQPHRSLGEVILREMRQFLTRDVFGWNDCSDRTVGEVQALLCRLRDLAKLEEQANAVPLTEVEHATV